MAEIVNLREMRKRKRREDKEKQADANRRLHGTPKHLRDTEEKRRGRESANLDGHRLESDQEVD